MRLVWWNELSGQVIWAATEVCLCSQQELMPSLQLQGGRLLPLLLPTVCLPCSTQNDLEDQPAGSSVEALDQIMSLLCWKRDDSFPLCQGRSPSWWIPTLLCLTSITPPKAPTTLLSHCPRDTPRTLPPRHLQLERLPAPRLPQSHLSHLPAHAHMAEDQRPSSDHSSKPDPCLWSALCCHQTWQHLGGAGGKEPTCRCRRPKSCRFNPWVRESPWRRAWHPTPVFLPGESHGQRSLVGYSP